MALNHINNGDSGFVARKKINDAMDEVALRELASNKATDLQNPDNQHYPTTHAVTQKLGDYELKSNKMNHLDNSTVHYPTTHAVEQIIPYTFATQQIKAHLNNNNLVFDDATFLFAQNYANFKQILAPRTNVDLPIHLNNNSANWKYLFYVDDDYAPIIADDNIDWNINLRAFRRIGAVYWDGTNFVESTLNLTTDRDFAGSLCKVAYIRPQGQSGGSVSVGWNSLQYSRIIFNNIPNSVPFDEDPVRFTFIKGLYYVYIQQQIYNIACKISLFADNQTPPLITSPHKDQTTSGQNDFITTSGIVYIDGDVNIKLYSKQHRTNGLGQPFNVGEEVYGLVIFLKII